MFVTSATVGNAVEHYRMSMRLRQLEREVEGEGYQNIVGAVELRDGGA